MKCRLAFMLLVWILALSPTALASNTWYVDGVNGHDQNDCKSPQTACKTIGHAISLAHSGDSIKVAPATYTENLTIAFNLTIVGSCAQTTIIDGGGFNTVVTISNANAHVALSKVTIRNGHAKFGGGIFNRGTLTINGSTIGGNSAFNDCPKFCGGSSGGIFNEGTLTINNSTVSGNFATAECLPYDCGGSGGGITNANSSALMTISKSTISGNFAGGDEGFGGGIDNGGMMLLNNSTINGNVASAGGRTWGGGILNTNTLAINNSTISDNSCVSVTDLDWGGGILNQGSTVTLQNSIVAHNKRGNCSAGPMTSNGYNLSSDGSCKFNNTGDLNKTMPLLGRLQNNGGPTQTIPLLSGSPAIDAGNPNGCTDGHGHLLKTDQRGKPRPDKEDTGGCDMGAYERQKD
jgi:hypothetical protein